MVVFKKRDSVPSARYSSVCNVLRQWRIWFIPTYRVYRLYDISLTVVSLFCITHSRQYVLYHSLSSVCSVSLTVVSITHSHPSHSQSSQSLSLILCSVNSLSIMHLTAHTIWPAAVYFCMAIITICARFRASYSA